jgi:hypothetical protein
MDRQLLPVCAHFMKFIWQLPTSTSLAFLKQYAQQMISLKYENRVLDIVRRFE